MPARVTERVHIIVSSHDVIQLFDAAVVFLRVCCKIQLTLMYVCPDNAGQLSHQCCADTPNAEVLERICCIDGDNGAALQVHSSGYARAPKLLRRFRDIREAFPLTLNAEV
jgi:hypothetical protein